MYMNFGDQIRIPCVIYRGGTSKGVFIKRNDLPPDTALRDRLLLAIFGSPDPRQIDGLGGSDPLTSKFALIGPSTHSRADVDYKFAQVSPDKPIVDWIGNCGNISSAVGPYSIDEGFVDASEPETTIRIHQVNMDRIIIAKVPVEGGKAKVEGDFSIAGVPGTGSEIELDFYDFGGSTTGKLLPTGNTKDRLDVEGVGRVELSVVDAANPVVFLRASEVGMNGIETPREIDTSRPLLDRIERIRGTVAELIGLVKDWKEASMKSPYIPFIAFVNDPMPYSDWTTGEKIEQEQIDLVSRLIFMGVAHKAYPVTGTVATGVAAKVPGTVVNDVARSESMDRKEVRIGHPAGIISPKVDVREKGNQFTIKQAAVGRTARRIMEGYVYVRKSLLR